MKFKITQSLPASQIYKWEVEAENEEEALHKVLNKEAGEPIYSVETDICDEDDYYEVDIIE